MKILVFVYDCGWEFPVRMEAGMNKTSLVARLTKEVTRQHRRKCKACRGNKITFTTAADDPTSQSMPPHIEPTSQFASDPLEPTNPTDTPPLQADTPSPSRTDPA